MSSSQTRSQSENLLATDLPGPVPYSWSTYELSDSLLCFAIVPAACLSCLHLEVRGTSPQLILFSFRWSFPCVFFFFAFLGLYPVCCFGLFCFFVLCFPVVVLRIAAITITLLLPHFHGNQVKPFSSLHCLLTTFGTGCTNTFFGCATANGNNLACAPPFLDHD